MSAFDLVTDEMIERKLTGWSENEWLNCRANFMEYQAAFGPEATKTFRQFAWTQAAMNCLYTVLQESK